METLEALERRIGSARDLATVVRTMKAMAAVGVRQMERAVESVSVYDRTVRLGFRVLAGRGDALMRPGPGDRGRLGLVVFGSDQGMCGGFNDRVLAYAAPVLGGSEAAGTPVVLVVGLRLAARLLDLTSIADRFALPASVATIPTLVQRLVLTLDGWLSARMVERISLIHNASLGGTRYEPRRVDLLPLDRAWVAELEPWPSRSVPLVRADAGAVLSSLVREHLFIGLFRACAESLAAENAARLAAMQRAERDIDDRIAELTVAWNNRRQTAITEELLDIVAGYEALSAAPGGREGPVGGD